MLRKRGPGPIICDVMHEPTIRSSKHIFVGSKAPWFTITDSLPQYEEHVVTVARPAGG